MASRIARSCQVIQTRQRGLATQVAQAKKENSSGLKTSKLSNGLTVASMDSGSAVSSVGFVVKCGSRNESAENAGVTHALRLAAGYAAKDKSAFGIVRNIQHAGGKMDVTGSREYMMYSAQMPRNAIGQVMEFVSASVESPAFKPWEMEEIVGRMAAEVEGISGGQLATELLHKAAYRHGLGNSIFAPKYMIGNHRPRDLADFHGKFFTADRTVLMGLDMDHDELVGHAEKLELPKTGAAPATPASKFHSGELRHEAGGKSAYIALAADGGSSANVTEAVANMLLQQILGVNTKVKYGAGHGLLQAATSNNSSSVVSAINFTYSDASLIGAFIAADAQSAGQVVGNVVSALRSTNVTEKDLEKAKKAMAIYLEDQMHDPVSRLEAVANHMAFGAKEAITPDQMTHLFEKATISDVKAAAKKLSNAKFSMAAVGNLANVPYLDQL